MPMARKSLKSLEKTYGVDSFFDYIINSVIEGHHVMTKELYNEMKPNDQKLFILHVVNGCDKRFLNKLFNSIL